MKNKKMLWLLFLAVVMGTSYVGYSMSEGMREGSVLLANAADPCDPEEPEPDPDPGDGPGNADTMPSRLMVA